MPQIGELTDCLLQIQEDKGTTQDAYGQDVPAWVTVAHLWARKRPVIGSDHLSLLKDGERGTCRFLVHAVPGIKPTKMRIVDGDVVYRIADVLPYGDGKLFLELLGVSDEVTS